MCAQWIEKNTMKTQSSRRRHDGLKRQLRRAAPVGPPTNQWNAHLEPIFALSFIIFFPLFSCLPVESQRKKKGETYRSINLSKYFNIRVVFIE